MPDHRSHPVAVSAYIAAVGLGLTIWLHSGGGSWGAAALQGGLMCLPVSGSLILVAMIVVAPFGILGVAAMSLHDRWRYR